MANHTSQCNICIKRIRPHENSIKCSLCLTYTHANCLPIYSDSDCEYASDTANFWTCPSCFKSFFPFNSLEADVDFIEAINNPINSSLDLDSLNDMVYDPFDTNGDDGVGFFDDIDPDQNFLAEVRGAAIRNCKYFYSSQLLSEIEPKMPNAVTSIITLNIRSIPKKFNTLNSTLNASGIKFNIIALTETWLKAGNADSYGIPDYDHEYLTRGDKAGGGSRFLSQTNGTTKLEMI
jgi:hypothetical protein